MSFVDKPLKCSDCGADFTFTASEQEFFAEKGYTNDPKRCQLCRATRKAQSNNSSGLVRPGDRCTRQRALSVARQRNCPLSPETADLCIAESATAGLNPAPRDTSRS